MNDYMTNMTKLRCWQDLEEWDGLRFSIFDLTDEGDMCVFHNELNEMKHIDFCTSHYDKNNKLLFVGDIVRSNIEGGEVKIDVIDDIRKIYQLNSGRSLSNSWVEFEFIGTMYENPELLKEVE